MLPVFPSLTIPENRITKYALSLLLLDVEFNFDCNTLTLMMISLDLLHNKLKFVTNGHNSGRPGVGEDKHVRPEN